MKVLVVGSGGREHALVRALSHSAMVAEVHAVPGNAGMSQEAVCHPRLELGPPLVQFVKDERFDLVVIGPEQPLADGLSDQLRKAGVSVFAPDKKSAQLEASKIFAKKFMQQAGVPTARFFEVSTVAETMKAARSFAPPYVLKADGLCAGKGVVICENAEQLEQAAHDFFEKKILGEAGARALLEEFQEGWELSCLILTNAESYEILPLAQDHKRLSDGDMGPNTGGMGVVAPLKIDSGLLQDIKKRVLDPVVRELGNSKMLYRGVLYVGLMITKEGPQVLEFNTRFGDPECQVILPLLKGDWADVFSEIAQGGMPEVRWKPLHAACVVLAAPGYPAAPKKDIEIVGDPLADSASSYFLHAGTAKRGESWVTNGGRVLNAIGIGSSLDEAIRNAYAQASKASWLGQQMRKDIGQKILRSNA
ncbi:MAG TPA: phosphoribosylamine--glycine ligase [Bdellovibrionales bacterium]|nr:phosphoribosylamine--glycine ligase [Bdellovibrionales bacterium]